MDYPDTDAKIVIHFLNWKALLKYVDVYWALDWRIPGVVLESFEFEKVALYLSITVLKIPISQKSKAMKTNDDFFSKSYPLVECCSLRPLQ